MFALEDPFLPLCTTRTVLIELRYALYLSNTKIRKTFPSLSFAAPLHVDSRLELLRSLDDACLDRVRRAAKYALPRGFRFADYEADRYVVWAGLEDAKLPLATLSDAEVAMQLEMMERRGCLDRLRVHLAVEVQPEVGAGRLMAGDDEEREMEDAGSVSSVETDGGGTVETVERRFSKVSLRG